MQQAIPQAGRTKKKSRNVIQKKWLLTVLLLVLVLIIDYPVFTIFLNAFRSTAEIVSTTSILPQHPTLANFVYLSARTNFWGYFTSSVIVSVIGTIISIFCAACAGYVLSRYSNFRFVRNYSRSLMIVQMFPLILALIPLFIIFRTVDLTETYWPVILVYTIFNLPFATWMFQGFFDAIPRELEEAAFVDGSSRLQTFTKVVIPLSAPGTAAVSIYTFLLCYNEYLIASIFLHNPDDMTIPVGIQMFTQQYATDWGSSMAAAALASIFPIVLFLFVQKYMIQGVVAGAVKG